MSGFYYARGSPAGGAAGLNIDFHFLYLLLPDSTRNPPTHIHTHTHSLAVLTTGFVRSWKTWKSHGILKWSFPGLEKSWKKLKSQKFWKSHGN